MNIKERLIGLLQDGDNPVWCWFPDNAAMVELVDYLLANDVTITQHGRWEHTKLEDEEWGVWHKWTCDNCGDYVVRNPRGTNFCPNCGARMD